VVVALLGGLSWPSAYKAACKTAAAAAAYGGSVSV